MDRIRESLDLPTKELNEEYKMISKLGTGSVGTVYLVQSLVNEKKYAAKKIDLLLE